MPAGGDEPRSRRPSRHILNLLKDLQEALHLIMLIISHDLVRHDRIGVMSAGEICELVPMEELFERSHHAYARELLRLMSGL
ncbi:hypothetical protein [Mesorhizobium carmichaelinearum]|uniref:hypothetical protein n=1 Tax=Mesorhizobium carmichaelinearum TaxID=1208188 RepID=UPI000BA33A88|nr:hypothetical protein [Mesorhizobium carmichaelinearum]